MDGTTVPDSYSPNGEQDAFLSAFSHHLNTLTPYARMRLFGGPGCGKSFTTVEAARRASDAGFVVFMLAPTHQAVGVLAKAARAAALPVRPYEPDPKVGLRAGQILTATTHSFARWVQKARSVSANYGAENPVARDSWIGRSMKGDWNDPPAGLVIMTDEVSMYQWQMSSAIDGMLARLRESFQCVLHLVVGDPDQLIPVRSNSYELVAGENMNSPSRYVVEPNFEHFTLTTNMRAKHPALRGTVEHYNHRKVIMPPPTGQSAYRWDYLTEEFWTEWVEKIEEFGVENCIVLAYRRAIVAEANDRLCRMIRKAPSFEMLPGSTMRVQETFAPAGSTMFHSSQLIELEDVVQVSDLDEIVASILPPTKGHDAVHDDATLDEIRNIVARSVDAFGAVPMAVVDGNRYPAIVATEHTAETPTSRRWNELLSGVNSGAFRSNVGRERVRRGLTSLFYHLFDSARLKLEPPFAMTSHRAQGSTYANVAAIADGAYGTRLVESPTDAVRHSSTYVMLSRASQSLVVVWPEPVKPLSSAGWF